MAGLQPLCVWYGQYTLFPIDFNGKPEIFLKHFKKQIFFKGMCVCDWTLIILQDSFALHYLMLTLFFLKKNFFGVYFNTNNFEIFSCQPCVTCVSHVGFLKFFFLLSHVLTFNFNFNSNRHA